MVIKPGDHEMTRGKDRRCCWRLGRHSRTEVLLVEFGMSGSGNGLDGVPEFLLRDITCYLSLDLAFG